jgi:hypothetical protein
LKVIQNLEGYLQTKARWKNEDHSDGLEWAGIQAFHTESDGQRHESLRLSEESCFERPVECIGIPLLCF